MRVEAFGKLRCFQGTNSVVSSLSSINSYGSERSLNLSDMANNAKMSKLLKIFEGKRYQGDLMRLIHRVFSRNVDLRAKTP